eukprot:5822063-Heterocapsa_arctica.AAC.1
MRHDGQPMGNLSPQQGCITPGQEAVIKRGVKWVDLDGTIWLREFDTPSEAGAWDNYFTSDVYYDGPSKESCVDPNLTTWSCVD